MAPISFADVKAFVLPHHYSHRYQSAEFGTDYFLGPCRRISSTHTLIPELVGVALFSVPQHPNVLTNVFPGNAKDSFGLGRFILLTEVKSNAETWFLSRCFEQLKRKGFRGVITFADDIQRRTNQGLIFPGRIDTIYQSTGKCLHVGRGARKTLHLFDDVRR